jgi:ornithine cyclodeaminase
VTALARVLDLDDVRVWSPDRGRREDLARTAAAGGQAPARLTVRATESARDAVAGADVVACCTASAAPVLETGWLATGATVISLGSFAPDRCEVPADLARQADAVVVDDVAAALSDAGPVIAAAAADPGLADRLIPLGEVIAGLRPARQSESDLVYYNSVGLGVQDAAAALAIVAAARAS